MATSPLRSGRAALASHGRARAGNARLDIAGGTRVATPTAGVVQARQISMYLAKSHTKTSLKSIGAFFGGRDHSTVIYACQTVEDLIDTDKKFKAYVHDIQKKLKMS